MKESYNASDLQGMMSDVRPEVRNTAVRTLFLVVSSQGSRLSDEAWEEVMWQLLYPLLRSVHHMAATSSREEVTHHESQDQWAL